MIQLLTSPKPKLAIGLKVLKKSTGLPLTVSRRMVTADGVEVDATID